MISREFKHLDGSALKAFYFAAQTLNFTRAAERAHLTQSGISQHIQKLEGELKHDLFLRVGKTLKLSPVGVELLSFCEQYLDTLDRFFESIERSEQELSGLVHYAMPSSCLMSPHFSILLQARKTFPGVQLKVEIKHSELVIDSILKGDLDFGFSTRHLPHPQLEFKPFVLEEFVLASSITHKNTIKNFEELKTLSFLSYPGQDLLAQTWINFHFGARSAANSFSKLRIRDEISSLDGAIQLAINAESFGFFPKHCIERELKEKKLSVIRGKRLENPQSPIYIVQLNAASRPRRVQRVLDCFWEMAKK